MCRTGPVLTDAELLIPIAKPQGRESSIDEADAYFIFLCFSSFRLTLLHPLINKNLLKLAHFPSDFLISDSKSLCPCIYPALWPSSKVVPKLCFNFSLLIQQAHLAHGLRNQLAACRLPTLAFIHIKLRLASPASTLL